MHKITVPVFLACQWTDEQTGGHCADLAVELHRHPAQVVHLHQRHPHRLARPGDLQPLVRLPRALRRAAERRSCSPALKALAPTVFSSRHGRAGREAAGRPDPGAADYAARARRVRGAAAGADPVRQRGRRRAPARRSPGFEQSFARFPLPGTRARSWYLGPAAPWPTRRRPRRGSRRLHLEPSGPAGDQLHRQHRLGHGRAVDRDARPTTGSRRRPGSASSSYLSAPLTANTTVVGAGALEAWIKSSAPERRPPGRRSPRSGPTARRRSCRTAGCAPARASSTAGRAPCSRRCRASRKADAAPLPKGRFTKVTVPLYYEGHVYRAGSRIRVDDRGAGRRPAGLGVRRAPRPKGTRHGDARPLAQACRRG